MGANAEDPRKGGLHEKQCLFPLDDSVLVADDRPVAPDQFEPNFKTSRSEIWAYYAYDVGNNGLSLFNFAPDGLSEPAVSGGGRE